MLDVVLRSERGAAVYGIKLSDLIRRSVLPSALKVGSRHAAVASHGLAQASEEAFGILLDYHRIEFSLGFHSFFIRVLEIRC